MHLVSRVLLTTVLLVGSMASCRAADVEPVLPKETEHVVSVNVKQILESEVVKKYAMEGLKQVLQGEDAKVWLGALGFDPLKDIERVTVGTWDGWEMMNAVGVMKGAFDAKKVIAAAKAAAEKNKDKVEVLTEKADGKGVTLVKMKTAEGKSLYLTVADEKTLLFGTDTKLAVAAVTDLKGKAKLSKELAALVGRQDEKASLFYCTVTEGKFKDVPAESFGWLKSFHDISRLSGVRLPVEVTADKFKKQVEKLNTAEVSLNLGKEMTFKAVGKMKDGKAADEFTDTLVKLVDTAKVLVEFLGGQQPRSKTLRDDFTRTLGVKAKDEDVTLSFTLTGKAVADLFDAEEKK